MHMNDSLMQFIAEKYLYTKTNLIYLLPINYIFYIIQILLYGCTRVTFHVLYY